ncbi:hypothetical protein CMU79_08085 [Elizabethkingia anophelis]|nr:hypothetical protein [Elizabethkingia anophelis]
MTDHSDTIITREIKYSIGIQTNFHIQNFLSNNSRINDSYFWVEESEFNDTLNFSSILLNELTEVQDIYDTANQIISIYEGIYKLLDRTRHNQRYFTLLEIVNLDEKRIISRSGQSELYKIDINLKGIKSESPTGPVNVIYSLFAEIVKDDFLTNLFFLLSNKVDYRMLYIIYDDIRFYLKSIDDNEFLKEFSTLLNRFTHTANNYEVLGFFARHGRTNHEPPKSPLNLKESMNLIFDIIVKLLREKFSVILPSFWGLMYVDFSEGEIKKLFEK